MSGSRYWACGAVVGIMLQAPVRLDATLAAQISSRPPATPVRAIDAVLEAFRTHAVVALTDGRAHGDQAGLDFRLALIRDPRFPQIVNDIVLEGGSAAFQTQIDRFVNGDLELSVPELQRPWHESTQPQFVLGTLSGAEWLLTAVRDLNKGLAPSARLRVLLADPPINWADIHTQDDHRRWIEQRDAFAADLVERNVVGRGRKGLVVFGGGHLQRLNQQTNYDMTHPTAATLASLLNRQGEGVLAIFRSDYELERLQDGIARWPVPSAAMVKGTQLGAATEPSIGPGRWSVSASGTFAPVPPESWRQVTLEAQVDGVLYLGSMSTLTRIPTPTTLCLDQAHVSTHVARMKLVGLPEAAIAQAIRVCPPQK